MGGKAVKVRSGGGSAKAGIPVLAASGAETPSAGLETPSNPNRARSSRFGCAVAGSALGTDGHHDRYWRETDGAAFLWPVRAGP